MQTEVKLAKELGLNDEEYLDEDYTREKAKDSSFVDVFKWIIYLYTGLVLFLWCFDKAFNYVDLFSHSSSSTITHIGKVIFSVIMQ